MAPVNFAGKLPVLVALVWEGEVVANAPTRRFNDFRYVIANDLVSSFTILLAGAGPGAITRTTTPGGKKKFDKALNTYVSDPVSGEVVDQLISFGKVIAHSIDLTVTSLPFFDLMLEQMTRTDADLRNLANPNDPVPILQTFTHRRAVVDIKTDFVQKSETFKDIPCRLIDHSVTPRPGKAPEVKLIFKLDFTPFSTVSRNIMRKLIALDWARLARFGKVAAKGKVLAEDVKLWVKNRDIYVLNHSDLDRANLIRRGIFGRHNGKSAQTLATDLRNDIDLHLVAANHWGQDREDQKTEAYQLALSDLFGTLHQTAFLASPVNCLRSLDRLMTFNREPLSRDDYAALALQYGVGHCGEHGDVAFSILTDMIISPGNTIVSAVLSGNANIDHVFVVYNIQVHDGILTTPVDPNNPLIKDEVDKSLRVFSLKDAIGSNPGRTGFVLDAYLDKKDKITTAAALLANITGNKRPPAKRTEFLVFGTQLVDPGDLNIADIRPLSATVRRQTVPNV